MGGLSVTWLLSSAALLGVVFLAPGFRISSGESALIVALVVGLASSILGRLLRLASGPVSLALCAALLVLSDAFVFRVTALLVPGFAMLGFWPAFLGAIPLSALHLFLRHAAGHWWLRVTG
jgi:putative membrane protein